MEYENLGKSGLKVSKIILGAMSFGNKNWRDWVMDDEDQIMKLLKHAYDRGIRTWDTADMYSDGDSERWIGKFLEKYNINRSTLTILSKVFMKCADDPNLEDNEMNWINRDGLSRKHIMDGVQASCERLGTYIDVYQIHRLDKSVPKEEIMEALHDVVKSGRVRYIGASSMRATEFAQLQFIAEKNNWTKFISMQNFYNLLYREEEREMIPFCQETGVGIIPWSPVGRGVLTRPLGESTTRLETDNMLKNLQFWKGDVSAQIIGRVQELATTKNCSMAMIAIAWALAKGTNPIVGFSSTKRIDEAIEALKIDFTKEEMDYLEEIYQPKPIEGHS